MDKLLDLLYQDDKFGLIVAKSLVITITFFIAVDEISKVIRDDIGILLLMAITFISIFFLYVEYEVKNAKKK
ncbi:MAG: hypothetical protein KKF44_10560 [Nanoarchaeota archaeon]|nr:hypothetical protein [Nanoarchaeota archaeon]